VFERAADPGEWAVSGAFMFADADPDALAGKSRAAFRGGFLGVASLGWSTLVQIVEATQEDRDRLVDTLGRQLHEARGAPHSAAGRAAGEGGAAVAASLSDPPRDPLIAVRRPFEDGATRGAFRPPPPRGTRKPMRAFSFLEVESEEEPREDMNLLALA